MTELERRALRTEALGHSARAMRGLPRAWGGQRLAVI
jgi:hypothetical protein